MLKLLIGVSAVTSCLGLPALAAESLTAEGSTPGSSNLTAILTLAELASQAGIANFQVVDGQTLTTSMQNVAEGKSDIVPAPLIAPFLLSRGAGPYSSLGKEKGAELNDKLAVLFTFSFGALGLYAFDSSGVHGWDALEGRNIINGPPSGGALANARAMIQIITGLEDGKGYTGVQSNWGQMDTTIADGSGDAMVLPIYFPDDRITKASAAGAVTMYSVPREAYEGEAFRNYLASPGTVGYEIPVAELPAQEGVSIHSEDGIWRSPMAAGAIVVRKDMDPELARSLTALMLENLAAFEAKGPYMGYVQLGKIDPAETGMCGNVPIKYHPGAVAAWEAAGFTVPDCAKP